MKKSILITLALCTVLFTTVPGFAKAPEWQQQLKNVEWKKHNSHPAPYTNLTLVTETERVPVTVTEESGPNLSRVTLSTPTDTYILVVNTNLLVPKENSSGENKGGHVPQVLYIKNGKEVNNRATVFIKDYSEKEDSSQNHKFVLFITDLQDIPDYKTSDEQFYQSLKPYAVFELQAK